MTGTGDIQESPVVFGGLEGDLGYDDAGFGEVDPDIQRMFYGDDERRCLTAMCVLTVSPAGPTGQLSRLGRCWCRR